VIPIILRHAYWKGSPFSKLQALPTNAEPIKGGNWRSIDATFEDVTEDLEKVISGFKKDKTIPPISSRKTIIVDQMHRGDFTTITEAIAAAAPGSRISIRPGVYDEGLIIDKPLEIVGAGEIGEVVIRALGKPAISFQAVRGRISNLFIRQNGGGNYFSVDIDQGCLELCGCDIKSDGAACIGVYGNAYPRIISNKIHNSKDGGIYVYQNGQGVIENNEIYGNALSAVDIHGCGNPTLKRNKIHDGKSSGIYIRENGLGVVEDNEIYGNALSGVVIKNHGNPTIKHNKIHDGKDCGIYVYESGQGLIENNEIYGNALSGVAISDGGNPIIKHNRINKNAYHAVQIKKLGAGTIEDNDFRENRHGPWYISEDSKSLVKRARNQE